VFTNSSFNNRFEHESSLFEPIPSKLTSSSARLHPYIKYIMGVQAVAINRDTKIM
jgi:hypothetical protein